MGTEILILDEPTSGLDSNLALQLVNMLRRCTREKNAIVIMTIHQPGAGLFELIDNLYFLYKGLVHTIHVPGLHPWEGAAFVIVMAREEGDRKCEGRATMVTSFG